MILQADLQLASVEARRADLFLPFCRISRCFFCLDACSQKMRAAECGSLLLIPRVRVPLVRQPRNGQAASFRERLFRRTSGSASIQRDQKAGDSHRLRKMPVYDNKWQGVKRFHFLSARVDTSRRHFWFFFCKCANFGGQTLLCLSRALQFSYCRALGLARSLSASPNATSKDSLASKFPPWERTRERLG